MASYVVTGASRGIGLAFINQLSAAPENTVFALVRSLGTATSLQELAASRKNVHVLVADVTDVPALLRAAATVEATLAGKGLDYLINNAAFIQNRKYQGHTLGDYAGAEDVLAEDFRLSFEVNVLGVVQATNAFLPLLQRGSKKRIINISSGRGNLELNVATEDPTAVPYCASKYALNFVTAKYAIQLRAQGFVVLAISPGLVETEANELKTEGDHKNWEIMTSTFKKRFPEWDGQMISTQESVRLVMDVAERFGPERSGEFVSHHGNDRWL